MPTLLPRVLHVTAMYPTAQRPEFGAFVAAQVQSLETLGVPQDVLVIGAGSPGVSYLRAIATVRRRVARGDVDVVHAHYGLAGVPACFQRLPFVVTLTGSDLNPRTALSGRRRKAGVTARALSQWVARRANRVIVMTERMRWRLRSRRVREECVVLPYGVDLERFVPGDREAARRHFDLGPHEFVALWPHGNTANKRRDLAEAAVQLARRRLPSARLWRPPPLSAESMPLCYQAADCMLVTSDEEGSPTVVKEALGAVLPVISVDVGDVWQHIADIPWCHRVARDAQSIADAIIGVSADRSRRRRPRVVEAFDSRAVASRLVGIYADAMGRSGRTL